MTRRFRLGRLPWLCLAWCSLGLGAAGTLLPLLPTTPFLLLAAWSAPKGSPRLALWLHRHPRFGPLLHAWKTERAVPRRGKISAVLLLALSWCVLWLTGAAPVLLILTGLLFLTIGAFLVSRPTPRRFSS